MSRLALNTAALNHYHNQLSTIARAPAKRRPPSAVALQRAILEAALPAMAWAVAVSAPWWGRDGVAAIGLFSLAEPAHIAIANAKGAVMAHCDAPRHRGRRSMLMPTCGAAGRGIRCNLIASSEPQPGLGILRSLSPSAADGARMAVDLSTVYTDLSAARGSGKTPTDRQYQQ